MADETTIEDLIRDMQQRRAAASQLEEQSIRSALESQQSESNIGATSILGLLPLLAGGLLGGREGLAAGAKGGLVGIGSYEEREEKEREIQRKLSESKAKSYGEERKAAEKGLFDLQKVGLGQKFTTKERLAKQEWEKENPSVSYLKYTDYLPENVVKTTLDSLGIPAEYVERMGVDPSKLTASQLETITKGYSKGKEINLAEKKFEFTRENAEAVREQRDAHLERRIQEARAAGDLSFDRQKAIAEMQHDNAVALVEIKDAPNRAAPSEQVANYVETLTGQRPETVKDAKFLISALSTNVSKQGLELRVDEHKRDIATAKINGIDIIPGMVPDTNAQKMAREKWEALGALDSAITDLKKAFVLNKGQQAFTGEQLENQRTLMGKIMRIVKERFEGGAAFTLLEAKLATAGLPKIFAGPLDKVSDLVMNAVLGVNPARQLDTYARLLKKDINEALMPWGYYHKDSMGLREKTEFYNTYSEQAGWIRKKAKKGNVEGDLYLDSKNKVIDFIPR